MAEEAIPSAANPLRSRRPSTHLPSLAQLYAAQQLGQPLQANSYTLPELYALEQTVAPLDLAPSADTNSPQQSQSPAPHDQSLPILVDQSGAPLQPESLSPGERLAGAVRAAGHGALGDLWDYGEAQARTNLGWEPNSTQARQAADAGFNTIGKIASHEDADYRDHLADIKDASKRFSNAYPAQQTAAWLTGAASPALAGFGTTRLLARILSGEPLIGELAAARAAEQVAPTSAPPVAKAEPAAASVFAGAKPAPAEMSVPVTDAAPEALAHAPATPDGRYYSVVHETKLKPKPKGTGPKGHIRESNENLLREMESDPEMAQLMQDLDVRLRRTPTGLAPDEPPPDHTWHHYSWEEGTMHLMPRWQHQSKVFRKVLHPFPHGGGGNIRWGHKFIQIPGAVAGGISSMQHPQDAGDNEQQEDE
jgi:hypothetical protein